MKSSLLVLALLSVTGFASVRAERPESEDARRPFHRHITDGEHPSTGRREHSEENRGSFGHSGRSEGRSQDRRHSSRHGERFGEGGQGRRSSFSGGGRSELHGRIQSGSLRQGLGSRSTQGGRSRQRRIG